MSISLTTIAADISAAYAVVEDLADAYSKLSPYISKLMALAETTYAAQTSAGASKLGAVLATIKAIAAQLGVDWSAGLEAAITAVIAAAKAAYTAFSGFVTGTNQA